MKLTIFGSTGGTGEQLVNRALEGGHEVTAFARSAQRVKVDHPRLTVVEGDVLDGAAVEAAVAGREAVLCSLGMPATNRQGLRARGTKNIIRAMKREGVRRLICQSGLGCGESHRLLPFHYKYLVFPLILRHVYADHEEQERHVRESGLEWTLVRPAALNDGAATGAYWHGTGGSERPLTIKISRADVADFMLKQLGGEEYLRQAPSLSYWK